MGTKSLRLEECQPSAAFLSTLSMNLMIPYASLKKALYKDIPKMMDAMGLGGEPLPVLWTADFIPVDGHVAPMVVGEFNCSCVGISAFLKACGPDKDLKDVSFRDFEYGMKLTTLNGKKAIETLDELKGKGKKK